MHMVSRRRAGGTHAGPSTVPYVDKVKSVKKHGVSQPRWAIWREIWKLVASLLSYTLSVENLWTQNTRIIHDVWRLLILSNEEKEWLWKFWKRNDYENFEKRGVIERRGGRRKRNPCPVRLWSDIYGLWEPTEINLEQQYRLNIIQKYASGQGSCNYRKDYNLLPATAIIYKSKGWPTTHDSCVKPIELYRYEIWALYNLIKVNIYHETRYLHLHL